MGIFNIGIKKRAIFSFLLIFLIGFLSNSAISMFKDTPNSYITGDTVSPINDKPAKITVFEVDEPKTSQSPSDKVKESQIHVYKNQIILDIEDASWAKFTDTDSMLPVIDKGANSIELTPKSAEDIHVGDIVSYRSEFADGIIIHRVIERGYDEQGPYFILKGDSLDNPDPGKIRFNQIVGVVVGIIY